MAGEISHLGFRTVQSAVQTRQGLDPRAQYKARTRIDSDGLTPRFLHPGAYRVQFTGSCAQRSAELRQMSAAVPRRARIQGA